MESAWKDVQYALRMLAKNRAFTAIAILSLALGIGANTMIFSVVNSILLNPLPVKEGARVMQLDTVDAKTIITQANTAKQGMSYQNFEDYERANQIFTRLACIVAVPLTWSNGSTPSQIQGQLVSPNYFQTLGLQPATGRFFSESVGTKLESDQLAVISYSFWLNRLGHNSNVVGKTLTLNAVPSTIIGIAPRGFKGTFTFAGAEQIWIPVSTYRQALSGFMRDAFNDRRFLATIVIGRLKADVSLAQAEASLKIMALHLEHEYPKENAGRTVALTPLSDTAVGANNHAQIVRAGSLMMGIVGFVLLIACANLVNLVLAQASRREKEMALRLALGANGRRVVRQLFTESIVLSLAGGVIGFFIAYVGRTALWSLRPPFLEHDDIDLALDSHVLLFTLTITLLTALLVGVAPALKATRSNLAAVLKLGGRGGTVGWTHNTLRNLLVITEVALALVALVCAGLFIRSMQFAQNINPGFESKNLFVAAFDLGALHYSEGRAQQFFRTAIERAKTSPSVKSAAVASNLPLAGGFSRTVFPEGQSEASGYSGTLTQLNDVSPTFFETLQIPIIRGRVFTESDRPNSKPVAMASEAMAHHFWPNQDAIGKRFHFFGEPTLREVVGTVGNTVSNQIGEEPQPLVYLPISQDYSPAATLQVRTAGRPNAIVATIRQQVQSLDPNLALTNVQTIEQIIAQGLWAARMGAGLLSVFGGLALVLAVGGVYGVLSYSVNQQTREIGIRAALGAQSHQVRWSIVARGLCLAGLGLLLGGIVAMMLTRALSSLLVGISGHDPLTFGVAALGLAAAAVLACYIPAQRATRVDPIVALRYE